jgi:hypothetical protein
MSARAMTDRRYWDVCEFCEGLGVDEYGDPCIQCDDGMVPPDDEDSPTAGGEAPLAAEEKGDG